MPYRKYGKKFRRRKTYQKSKTLAPKNIKRRKSASAQSKQIATLARKVRLLNKNTFIPFQMQWGRQQLSCQTLATSGIPYVCPLVRMPCNPSVQGPIGPDVKQWRDSLALAAQPAFQKTYLFNIADEVVRANTVYHSGSILKYQVSTTEPGFEKLTLMVVQPHAKTAAQTIADNALDGDGSVPYGPKDGSTNFQQNLDYCLQDGQGASQAPGNYFGVMVNYRRWKVLYKREICLGHPGATNTATNVNPSNTDPGNNSLTARGTIKLPGLGRIQSVSRNQIAESNAVDQGILDQAKRDNLYLVAISSGVSGDNEQLFLSWNCVDSYRAVC